MATIDKKYLDQAGLEHLIDKKAILPHPEATAASPAAVKVGTDANGHVVLGTGLQAADVHALPDTTVIGDGKLTIKANGAQKGVFTANQTGNTEIDITLTDFGLTEAMHFIGTTTTAIEDGSTTSSIMVNSKTHAAASGDVVLYGGKEFVWNGTSWEELGDESSHALKSVSIKAGTGLTITEGGTLAGDTTIAHGSYEAVGAAAVKVGRDATGHVVLGAALGIGENGAHTHSVSSTIPAQSFVDTVGHEDTKISIDKKTSTAITNIPGTYNKLVRTSITGVAANTVKVSKATALTAVNVATVDNPVVCGTANVGDAKSVTTFKDNGANATVGNANIAIDATTVVTGLYYTDGNSSQQTGTAYQAEYDEANECLELTALTLGTTGIYEATPATRKFSDVLETESITPAVEATRTITPAKANGSITPYSFTDYDVAQKASSATTVATGGLALDADGGEVMVGLGTLTTATVLNSTTVLKAGDTGDVTVVSDVSFAKNTAAQTISGTAASNGAHTHNIT